MRARFSAVLVVTVLALPSQLFAWGQDGHRIVCRIAFDLLTADEQNEVSRLIDAYKTPDNATFENYAQACIFPDDARSKANNDTPGFEKFKPFDHWHFINVPRDTKVVEESECHDDCVLKAIAFHTAQLKNATNDSDRAEALMFLGHWVGDVHQPLHVSFQDDLGGNSIKLPKNGFYPSANLHSVWDSGIVRKDVGEEGWGPFAERLAQSITPADRDFWITATPVEWAGESYVITTSPKLQYCHWSNDECKSNAHAPKLDEQYQTFFSDDVETRLQQAGARLAHLIHENLQH